MDTTTSLEPAQPDTPQVETPGPGTRRRRRRTIAATVTAVLTVVVGLTIGFAWPTHSPAPGFAAPPNQPPSENLYVPITPCRIVDTRAGTGTGGTPFSPLQVRTYYVSGTFGFAPQGGKAGGCGIPGGAVALAANFLVVSPTGGGRLHSWPNGQTEPTATTYYYGAHTGSTGVTVTINPSTAYSMKVRNYSATTDVVIDVTGYYVKPLVAVIQPDGALYAGTSRALSSSRISEGQYRLKFDRNVRNCAVQATVYAANYSAGANTFSYSAQDLLEIRVYDGNASPVDQYVYVVATC